MLNQIFEWVGPRQRFCTQCHYNFGPSDGIIIRHLGINPLTTVMEIQTNLINESFTSSCVPVLGNLTHLPSEAVTEEYIAFSPSQVDIMRIEQMCDASFMTGSITCSDHLCISVC